MGDTYTTSWTTVSDGDTTSINPENLVGTRLNIVNSHIEWKGVQTSEQTTSTEYQTNQNSTTAEATESTSTDTDYNSGGGIEQDEGVTQTNSFPSPPSGYDFDYHELTYNIDIYNDAPSDIEVEITLDSITGEQTTSTISNDSQFYDGNDSTNHVGESRSFEWNVISDHDSSHVVGVSQDMRTHGVDETTSVSSDTSCTSYPSVPSGYNFDRHYWREEKNYSYHDSDYVYSNNVGDSRCVTSDDPDTTWLLEMRTRGEKEVTDTNYYDTLDPSVSGDVSGSYTGTLNDGSTSGWQSLSGLTSGSNNINHNIQESNKAEYRIKFDWENAVPNVKMIRRININGTEYDVALADPTDEALKYNFYRVQTSEGVLAYDIVDPTDAGALPRYIQHPDHGKVAFREYTE